MIDGTNYLEKNLKKSKFENLLPFILVGGRFVNVPG